MDDQNPTPDTTELRLILAMAPSFQGGHSQIGGAVADYLGIPFPLSVANLEKKAMECGFDPNDLWPWRAQVGGPPQIGVLVQEPVTACADEGWDDRR